MIKKMESIGIFVMLEQEDVIITQLAAVPHLKDKSEPVAKQVENDQDQDALRRRATTLNFSQDQKSFSSSGWKSMDDGHLSL
jgi:hypothetical protein